MSIDRKNKNFKTSSGHVVEPEEEEVCIQLEEHQQQQQQPSSATTSQESQQCPLQNPQTRTPRLKSQVSESPHVSVGDGSVKSSSERRYTGIL